MVILKLALTCFKLVASLHSCHVKLVSSLHSCHVKFVASLLQTKIAIWDRTAMATIVLQQSSRSQNGPPPMEQTPTLPRNILNDKEIPYPTTLHPRSTAILLSDVATPCSTFSLASFKIADMLSFGPS
ncbi:hypothetical protein AVEN_195273-1 [Araneus ventricosus]|uniref:Uncharacterized protein n=1 Tax=Araneus ventricosus TaxID=182803 RepID=A0A4Y2FYW3_ARAVE|nr:hypothetical protein AVEN_195273-1 [Araneus ventricosus]